MLLTLDQMNGTQQDNSIADSPLSHAHHSTTWTPIDSMTPISTNPSRKRSRHETDLLDGEEVSYFSFPPSAQQVEPPPPIPEEPIYGEGMTLLNPTTGRALGVDGQTGTWYEEKVDQEDMRQQYEQEQVQRSRPKIGARKSIRLSQSSIRAAVERRANGLPATPPPTQPNTDVDEATIALGIGWTRVSSDDPDMQAAVRGWERYLDVHYSQHIHSANLLLKHKGLEMYLVQAQEGYFLFKEDLTQGQLVSQDWETCLNNLRSSPPTMDGHEVLQAEQIPTSGADEGQREIINGWNGWAGINGAASMPRQDQDVDPGGMEVDT